MTRNVKALLAAIFCAYWVQIAVLILAPLKAIELGYPAWAAVALAALWGLLAVVLDLPASALSDQRGRRTTVIGGGMLMAASTLALAFATDYLGLALGIVLFGVGQAFTVGPMLAFLTESTAASEQRRIQGINGFVQGVSSVVAAVAAGLLAQIDFFLAFMPLLLASIGTVVAVTFTRESILRTRPARGRELVLTAHVRAIRMVIARPALSFATLSVVLFAVAFTVVASTVLPIVLVDFEGYSAALVGVLLAFRNLTAAGVALTFAPVTRRWGVPGAQLRTGMLAVIGTALFAITTGEPLLLLVALAIQGIGVAYTAPVANVLIADATGTGERAVGIAGLTVATRATVLVVPLALAPFLTASAGGTVFVLAAGLSAAILVGMVLLSRRIPDQVEDEHGQTMPGEPRSDPAPDSAQA